MTATDRDLAALLAADLRNDKAARLALADLLTDTDGAPADVAALRAGKVPGWMLGERRYYRHCPRGFSNEYTILVVRKRDEARLVAAFPEAARITAKYAWRCGVTRPAEARRDGEQWFGGFAGGYYGEDREEALANAEKATLTEITMREDGFR